MKKQSKPKKVDPFDHRLDPNCDLPNDRQEEICDMANDMVAAFLTQCDLLAEQLDAEQGDAYLFFWKQLGAAFNVQSQGEAEYLRPSGKRRSLD